eukprot:11216979-Lingulodinium_polyedra.AAC.1
MFAQSTAHRLRKNRFASANRCLAMRLPAGCLRCNMRPVNVLRGRGKFWRAMRVLRKRTRAVVTILTTV